jgi:acetylornithine deacetylase
VLTVDPIALAVELVRIPSPTGSEAAVCEHVAERLAALGWSVQRQPVGEGGRFNILATRGTPVVVLSTHLDTVLPELPIEEDEEWLVGRGSADAKGIAAAQIAAAERLVAAGEERVALLFVVGEEGPSDGARAAATLEPKGRFLVNGEPTENHLALGTKGSIRLTLTTRGRPAHSAYPEEGDSAIERMLDLLQALRALDFPADATLGSTTMNIGTIEGGTAPNIIPDRCRVELMFRTVGPADAIVSAVTDTIGAGGDLEVTLQLPPVHLSTREGFPTTVVRFGTDLPFLEPWGERFLLGPGTIRVAHTERERIGKAELREAVDLYERLARLLIAEAAE